MAEDRLHLGEHVTYPRPRGCGDDWLISEAVDTLTGRLAMDRAITAT